MPIFFGESLENQKLVPLSAICSGCHNGFVRLWILYLSAVKVCIFGSKFLPSCGSGTSLSLVPPIRDLYRGGSTMGGRQMAPGRTVKQRKALSLGALPGLPNKGQERQNHPHHNHHKCTVPPQKRLIATLKIETKKFPPPLCSPPPLSCKTRLSPHVFVFSWLYSQSQIKEKNIFFISPTSLVIKIVTRAVDLARILLPRMVWSISFWEQCTMGQMIGSKGKKCW